MTSIAHQPRTRWRRASTGVDEAGRTFTLASRPRGLITVGLAAVLISAWGGIVPYLGPTFGYRATNAQAWQWSAMHAWIYLLPGVVGIVFGGVVLFGVPKAWHPQGRAVLGFAGLVLFACGAWFVLSPAVWPILSSVAVFSPAGATTRFVNELGYNSGVGLILAALGGMAIKAARSDRLSKELTPAAGTGTETATAPVAAAPPDAPVDTGNQ